MKEEGDILTKESVHGAFYASFEDKYIIVDNLDCKTEPMVRARQSIYNTMFTYITYVVRGTLNINVNGELLEIQANEYILITPFTRVAIEDSRCLFYIIMARCEIANDVFEHTAVSKNASIRCFKYYHRTLPPQLSNLFQRDYKMMKTEMTRRHYPMREMAIRAFFSTFFSHIFSFRMDNDEINHAGDTRQELFFGQFLELLSVYCKKERSVQFYADKINITPKYLSNIVNLFTGMSASVVIDQYVTFRIKQVLYANDYNIKTISDMFNFPNQSFFGRYFKRIVHMSPNDYLKHYNKKAIGQTK